MSLHCDADEMLARAKDLFARGHHAEARTLAIDAGVVFEQAGNAKGVAEARRLASQIDQFKRDG